LKGDAKIKRAGRRGTRVELHIDDLPRASELGGIYTTYILWAISPDGHVDNLGEIKRSGSSFVDSKLDVTTPLQTFAMILETRATTSAMCAFHKLQIKITGQLQFHSLAQGKQ
jgi:hypothetical protein